MKKLENRIALITGASRGIGAAVAKRFAAEGAQVILTARTVGGLEEVDDAIRKAGGKPATLVPLNLREFDKIDTLGLEIYNRFGKLDILVGNAGALGELAPLPHLDPKAWQQAMEVNVTANWRLIRSMDALLRASDAGRAIFVTSGVAAAPRAYWAAYGVSKAALAMLAGIYAEETRTTPLRVNLVDPGEVRTAMHAQAKPGYDETLLPAPETVTDAFLALALPSCTRHGETLHAQQG
jgi:NAD(P)-dependent dehydrogenase (short-subunit alcohol dehydrogenase family)